MNSFEKKIDIQCGDLLNGGVFFSTIRSKSAQIRAESVLFAIKSIVYYHVLDEKERDMRTDYNIPRNIHLSNHVM